MPTKKKIKISDDIITSKIDLNPKTNYNGLILMIVVHRYIVFEYTVDIMNILCCIHRGNYNTPSGRGIVIKNIAELYIVFN